LDATIVPNGKNFEKLSQVIENKRVTDNKQKPPECKFAKRADAK